MLHCFYLCSIEIFFGKTGKLIGPVLFFLLKMTVDIQGLFVISVFSGHALRDSLLTVMLGVGLEYTEMFLLLSVVSPVWRPTKVS